MTINNDFLKLNLQFFAEEGANGGAADGGSDDDKQTPDEPADDKKPDNDGGDDEKKFTQAEFEAKLKERLARKDRQLEEERKAAEEEAERKRLEEQGEYKTLLEKANERIAEFEAKEAARERREKVVDALKTQGLTDEQANKHAKWVEKSIESDDDIEAVASEYASEFKTDTYADPSAGYGKPKKAEPQSDENYGQEVLDRVRGLTKTQYK